MTFAKLFAFFLLFPTLAYSSGIFNPGSGSGSPSGSATDLTPGDTDYIQNRATLQVGATYYVSSGTVKTQLNLPSIPEHRILFVTSGTVSSDGGLAWDTDAGAFTLGGGSGDPTSWMTINGAGAINALYIKDISNNTSGLNVQGNNTVGMKVSGGLSTVQIFSTAGSDTICNGTSLGDSCLQARRAGIPPFTRSGRLFIQGDNYPDGSSSQGPPQIIVAPTGVVLNAGPASFVGQVAMSTPTTPVQVGWGTFAPTIVGSTQSLSVNYPGDSYLLNVDATSKVQTFIGVKASKSVIGTSTTTWNLPDADASGCLQSDGVGNLTIASCAVGSGDNLGAGTGNYGVSTTTGGFTGAGGVSVTFGVLTATITVVSTATLQGSFVSTPITKAQITGDQNNYLLGSGMWFRLDSDAQRTITGITLGIDGRQIILTNAGAFNLVFANQNAGSTDANKIITGVGGSLVLPPDQSMRLIYDGTTARWRVL